MTSPKFIRTTFHVNGMHCPSCELLIEKKLIKEPSINMVDAKLSKNLVIIEHQAGDTPTVKFLNTFFKADNYQFSFTPFKNLRPHDSDVSCGVPQSDHSFMALFIAGILIVGFLLLNQTGITNVVSVNSNSSLPLFLVFGVLAGFSSCAALVGGIILSLSKQWADQYGHNDNTFKKLEPHFLFNTGRVLGYTFFGAILGLIGNFFQLSPFFTALLVILVSVLMVVLGLQMLGVKALASFQLRLPKSLTGSIANESNFTGRLAPAIMGVLTFFLPCGFTLTTQALALTSGNPITGAIIMGLFALGTIPGLMAIGYSSVKLHSNPKTSAKFSTIAGYLILFFALFNLNNQLAVIGLPSLSSIFTQTPSNTQSVKLSGGKQIVTMVATSGGYSPNTFTVKVGVPVSWQITNDGHAGCGSWIIARSFFPERLDTFPGETLIKEFTPTQTGTFHFSCSMGMYTGTFNVIN